MWEYISHVREAFVVKAVRFSEHGAKQGEVPVGNWCTELNKTMAHDARVVSCVVECCGGSEPREASWGAY